MTRSFKDLKSRLAPSVVALLASSGSFAWADDGAAWTAPGQFIVTGAVAPIAPVGHTADEEDPPPAPPFAVTPLNAGSGRRSLARPLSLGPAHDLSTETSLAPAPPHIANEEPSHVSPEHVHEAPVEDAEGTTVSPPDDATGDPAPPVQLPDEIHLDAKDLSAPPVESYEEVPEVKISAPPATDAPESELVQERFPNGSLKVAREVTQDGSGNFINHGSWKEWNLQGDLIASGEYVKGVRQGAWRRVLVAADSKLFATAPYNQYQGPFVSEAQLNDGRLDGMWIITDGQGRKISEIEFVGGVRNGVASWWHNNGRKMQQINFKNGAAVEEILAWRPDGALAAKEEYHDGRKLETKPEFYAQNRRKSLGDYLSPRMVVTQDDDWWNCRLATFTAEGTAERHGAWTAWHPNGQVQVEGHFEFGKSEGEFTWYYANGQKSAEGSFLHDERHGTWTWWHDNGLKSSMGEFIEGKAAGKWTWWTPDGKVAQKADFADGVPAQAFELHQPTNQAARPSPNRNFHR